MYLVHKRPTTKRTQHIATHTTHRRPHQPSPSPLHSTMVTHNNTPMIESVWLLFLLFFCFVSFIVLTLTAADSMLDHPTYQYSVLNEICVFWFIRTSQQGFCWLIRMNQRSHIILCMSRNKIFAGDDSSSQQDLAPTTRRKSVHAFIKLCCYFYGHHEEDHPLCSTFFLLLDLFDNPRTQLPGPRDSNYWCCYYGWCARSFHGTAFPSMDHDRSRKREATQATTRVKSQTSWQGGPVN